MRRKCYRLKGTKEIAEKLGVSPQTVWNYRSSRTGRGRPEIRAALEAEGVKLPPPRRRARRNRKGGAR